MAIAIALALTACAGLPRDQGYRETGELIRARIDTAPSPEGVRAGAASAMPTLPMTLDQAMQFAFERSPRVSEAYARLGLGRADLEDARRIGNPSLGYSRLSPSDASGARLSHSVSFALGDLLLLPTRKRFAAAEFERLQQSVADELLQFASDVEHAWFESVGAVQISAMRSLMAGSAGHAAELAQRFFDAGNISRLQLERELAAASSARIAALRADTAALEARSKLAGLTALPMDAAWTTPAQLPAPPPSQPETALLVELALQQRLDLSAARRAVAVREDALGVTRRWRWIGSIEAGYEREREGDGGVLRGPTLSLQLPIFNQGQGAIGRAQAELLDARARLDAQVLSVHNEVRSVGARLALKREIVDRYQQALLPQREAVVARTQEQQNFMLVGVFELIAAKQDEYDAYQEYLEAVRDYWTSRSELRRVVGGRLPDEDAQVEPTPAIDPMPPDAATDGDPTPEQEHEHKHEHGAAQ